MRKFSKNLFLWVVVGSLLIAILGSLQSKEGTTTASQVAYSQFLSFVDEEKVRNVTIRGNKIEGSLTDGRNFSTYAPDDPSLLPKLTQKKVLVNAAPPEQRSPGLFNIILSWLPFLFFIGILTLMAYQMQNAGGKGMGFGRSKARLQSDSRKRVTFNDVAGIDEAKQELKEIVEFLKDPSKFQRLGGRIPKGALLVGPPGTGKTLLARAIAGEARVPFFTISGSDFVEMFVGVGASRVRSMFEQAKKHSPCIVFIDEIDAVGRHRGAGLGGGNDEREQTLNQLLVEMDGFDANDGVILIAATNRPDVLDPALLRPGRFDRQVVVPNPDVMGREKILEVHAAKIRTAPDIDLKTIARGTPGFSGADLENLMNEAALLAASRDKRVVTMSDVEEAKDKVLMGAARRSMVMSDKEKELTAYHEAGHAVVGLFVEGNDPLHKVTIIPRGRALGVTMNLPAKDRYSISKSELEARLAMVFGGRVAEELTFGAENVTSGASDDIRQATAQARDMVTKYGMSEKVGPLRLTENEEEVFLGHSVAQRRNVSDATAKIIDEEVKKILETAQIKARQILTKHKSKLHLLAKSLLERESLSGAEVSLLFKKGKLPPLATAKGGGGKVGSSVPKTPAFKVTPKADPATP